MSLLRVTYELVEPGSSQGTTVTEEFEVGDDAWRIIPAARRAVEAIATTPPGTPDFPFHAPGRVR